MDVSICVDDTLCKGVESLGLVWVAADQPSDQTQRHADRDVARRSPRHSCHVHRKETPYKQAIVKAIPSYSGLWVFKMTTPTSASRCLSKILPELFAFNSVQQVILEDSNNPLKATSAAAPTSRVTTVTVQPNQGIPRCLISLLLPKWHEMRDGISIPAIAQGHQMETRFTHKTGGFQPARNPRSRSSPRAPCDRW